MEDKHQKPQYSITPSLHISFKNDRLLCKAKETVKGQKWGQANANHQTFY
jgi:hypothetical protein